MSISESVKQLVRRRADYVCEYCGVKEQNAGGELTVDHFRPKSQNGGDEPENLIYCCVRCNLYKGDFWVELTDTPQLWNPRLDPFENHFWQAGDGRLLALTPTGELSSRILNLNRPQLIADRQQQYSLAEERRLLHETQNNLEVLSRVETFVIGGGREGVETDACCRTDEATKWGCFRSHVY